MGIFSGWGHWYSNDILTIVDSKTGFAIRLRFKQHNWIDEGYLGYALFDERIKGLEVKPGYHTIDHSYSRLDLVWQENDIIIECLNEGDDCNISIKGGERSNINPAKIVVETAILWGNEGTLYSSDTIGGSINSKEYRLLFNRSSVNDPFIESGNPYKVFNLEREPLLISTTSIDETLSDRFSLAVESYIERTDKQYGGLAESLRGIESIMAWNTIFDPTESRVVTTVGRLWNREYGGWCLFGWDNFFISYVSLLFDKQFAIHNCMEHLKGVTDEGFIANDHRGNGTWSWDRSQPIVGSLMVDRIYKATEDIDFLKEAFPYLLRWNEWYFENRMNGKLLSYGSHKSTNLYNEPHISTTITAKYESGMDDSPMYDDIKFNSDTNVLEMWDIGLNSLYLKDCELLIRFAKILGEDYSRVEDRYNSLKSSFDLMWSDKLSAYVNVDTAEGTHLSRVSPTIFYPMLLDFIPKDRVEKIISNYFNSSEKFGIEYMLPSVAVDDKDYQRQRYWRGSIWPPLNFLTYLGFSESKLDSECSRLAESSWKIFDSEWRRKHYVCENYCSINGLGDDSRISSDRFHTWGVLMAIPKFIEKGLI